MNINLSAANLFGSFLFGTIGFSVFIYGKKQASFKSMVIGIVLMVYPYFIPQTIFLYLAGIVLVGALFIFRD